MTREELHETLDQFFRPVFEQQNARITELERILIGTWRAIDALVELGVHTDMARGVTRARAILDGRE